MVLEGVSDNKEPETSGHSLHGLGFRGLGFMQHYYVQTATKSPRMDQEPIIPYPKP